ncbi:hypothetical protein [Endozoicomonas sp. ALD040]|uniref:hypothetical protein n=1 Tax=Endozoicomonas sp. ALD040 TaxID=3403079 RepID=UPI003BAE882C
MSKIEITQREMDRAFRSHHEATRHLPSSCNPSKLVCLFYAVECGLKSLIIKRERHQTSEGIDHYGFEHNINKMLSHLRCGKKLRLPVNISLDTSKPNTHRDTDQSKLNQVWRYGVKIKNQADHTHITQTLENICHWVK